MSDDSQLNEAKNLLRKAQSSHKVNDKRYAQMFSLDVLIDEVKQIKNNTNGGLDARIDARIEFNIYRFFRKHWKWFVGFFIVLGALIHAPHIPAGIVWLITQLGFGGLL